MMTIPYAEKFNMTREEQQTFLRAVGAFVHEQVQKQTASLVKRVTELEQRPQSKYIGTWNGQTKYREGEMATHQGSVWCCRVSETTAAPGGPDGCWQLAVKRGRDGKDAAA